MKYVYIIVIGVCMGFIAPFSVALAAALMVYTAAFLVARLVEEDRR
jgi:ABC-type transport system involved in cytochrome c biogenesis permease subunit